jgi:hypothetical protein
VAVRPDCIAKPANPVPRGTVPAGGKPYKVKDGDSWQTLAAGRGMDAWAPIRYNYPSVSPDNRLAAREVNWYLRWYVGCQTATADAKNYMFSSRDNPGIVYLPPAPIKLDFRRFNIVLPYMYGEMMTNADKYCGRRYQGAEYWRGSRSQDESGGAGSVGIAGPARRRLGS